MNEIDKAYLLSTSKKQTAKQIYLDCLREIDRRDYAPLTSDRMIDMSALFGERWVLCQHEAGPPALTPELVAEANVAFNYANLQFNGYERFVNTAKSLVPQRDRVSNADLRKIGADMRYVLTGTTAEKVIEAGWR
jgi:hypothetical protein